MVLRSAEDVVVQSDWTDLSCWTGSSGMTLISSGRCSLPREAATGRLGASTPGFGGVRLRGGLLMATNDQVKALVKSHADGDDPQFYAVAMQVAGIVSVRHMLKVEVE